MAEESQANLKLERGAAADLWRNTLSQIPTTFGRLVYLASLRDQNSGTYEHHGLSQIFGAKEADKTLRQSHVHLFADWLNLNLEQQKQDLQTYLSGLEDDLARILSTWARLAPYRNLIPARAREVEKQLYLSDIETVLDLLKHEYGVAYLDPNA